MLSGISSLRTARLALICGPVLAGCSIVIDLGPKPSNDAADKRHGGAGDAEVSTGALALTTPAISVEADRVVVTIASASGQNRYEQSAAYEPGKTITFESVALGRYHVTVTFYKGDVTVMQGDADVEVTAAATAVAVVKVNSSENGQLEIQIVEGGEDGEGEGEGGGDVDPCPLVQAPQPLICAPETWECTYTTSAGNARTQTYSATSGCGHRAARFSLLGELCANQIRVVLGAIQCELVASIPVEPRPVPPPLPSPGEVEPLPPVPTEPDVPSSGLVDLCARGSTRIMCPAIYMPRTCSITVNTCPTSPNGPVNCLMPAVFISAQGTNECEARLALYRKACQDHHSSATADEFAAIVCLP